MERRRPFWHWLLGGLGAAAGGVGGYLYVTDPAGEALDEAEASYEEYQNATEVDEVVRLRDEAEAGYQRANTLEAITWGSIGAGAGLVTTALVSRVASVGRPERRARRYAREEHAVEMGAAEALFSASNGEEEAGLLVVNRGRVVTTGREIHATPWYSEREIGEEVEVEGGVPLSLPEGDPRRQRPPGITIQPGLNVLILE